MHRTRTSAESLLDRRDRAEAPGLRRPKSTPLEDTERADRWGSRQYVVEGNVALRPFRCETPRWKRARAKCTTGVDRGAAETPSIPVATDAARTPAEELRLRFRQLDLRRPELQEPHCAPSSAGDKTFS